MNSPVLAALLAAALAATGCVDGSRKPIKEHFPLGTGGSEETGPEYPPWEQVESYCTGADTAPEDAGNGECGPPPEFFYPGRCACWPYDLAPGVEACPPSPATPYGPQCCMADFGCGHDFGAGCTSRPITLPGETADAGNACDVAAGRPGLLAEGQIPIAALGSSVVAFVEYEGAVPQITTVDKTTCARQVYDPGELRGAVSHIVVTEDRLYITEDGRSKLSSAPLTGGTFEPIPLDTLFGLGEWADVINIAVSGSSLYALVASGFDGGITWTLIEVPCCGRVPRILPASTGLSGDSVGIAVDSTGAEMLVTPSTQLSETAGYYSALLVDLASGATRRIIDNADWTNPAPSHLRAGRLFSVQSYGILSLSLASCSWEPWTETGAVYVSSLAVTDDAIYWGENYQSVTVSRVFGRRDADAQPTQLVETSGRVEWLGADAAHVYWREYQEGTVEIPGGSRVMRIERM